MARSRGRSAPARAPAQTRSAHTVAAPRTSAPPAHAPAPRTAQPSAPVAPQQQPGLFAQMASTAAGVAVGSAVGHTIGAGLSGMFGGGSSAAAEPASEQQLQAAPTSSYAADNTAVRACDVDARNFTRCLDENSGNMQICDWYLQQLKACQEAARQY